MKKIFIIIVLLFNLIFIPKVDAQEKLKVLMFNWEGTLNSISYLETIKNIDGYGENFELIVLNVYTGGSDEILNEEYGELMEKAMSQYNDASGENITVKGFPTFVIGNELHEGDTGVEELIEKTLKQDNYNATYECLLGDYDYNCFNGESLTKSKLQKNIAYVIPLFLFVIILLIWLCLK